MSDFTDGPGLRSLLPTEPGRWLWARLQVYLLVLVTVVVGFFFVADWQAQLVAPPDVPEAVWFLGWASELLHALMILAVSGAWTRAWRGWSGRTGHGHGHS
jgi:hypothetical protein